MRWRAEDRRRMLAAAVDLALPTRAAQEGRRCSAMVMVVGNCRKSVTLVTSNRIVLVVVFGNRMLIVKMQVDRSSGSQYASYRMVGVSSGKTKFKQSS